MHDAANPPPLLLRALADRYPTVDHAIARIGQLRAEQTLPKGTIHVFSDVHGEYAKLRHVINNGSGNLRPVVEQVFEGRLREAAQRRLLNLIYYPRETWQHAADAIDDPSSFVREYVGYQLEVLRHVARDYPLARVVEVLPEAYRDVLVELVVAPALGRTHRYVTEIIDTFIDRGRGPDLLRWMSRCIRNLLVEEILVAGDVGDRGPRIDKVVAYLMHQPNVWIVWGNHDVLWMGATLGQRALIATVIRVSLRYGRVLQLEEGYGVPLLPLVQLAQEVYGDDPAEQFVPRAPGLMNPALVARMQKAIAIIQFKLEGQLIARHPDWGMDDRRQLHLLDLIGGTIDLPERQYELLDRRFPTVDPDDPYALSDAESRCIEQLRSSFMASRVLWEQMSFLFERGSMYVVRDAHLIFHACLPVDDDGATLRMPVRGERLSGKPLFDALQGEVQKAWRDADEYAQDLLWYLWAGPASPLFGKDRMATFERYFLADKATHKETKNPFFDLIDEREFADAILASFGVDAEHGLIVNGHVPVKTDKGESPVKSRKAVVIDGAFAEAYGDRGYTLLLEAGHTCLAEHHHFASIAASIRDGEDIVPQMRRLRVFDPPRTRGDTEEGRMVMAEIDALDALISAYRTNTIPEQR